MIRRRPSNICQFHRYPCLSVPLRFEAPTSHGLEAPASHGLESPVSHGQEAPHQKGWRLRLQLDWRPPHHLGRRSLHHFDWRPRTSWAAGPCYTRARGPATVGLEAPGSIGQIPWCNPEAAPPFPALDLLTHLRTQAQQIPRPLPYFPGVARKLGRCAFLHHIAIAVSSCTFTPFYTISAVNFWYYGYLP
jgi:hypothetical protein